MTRQSWPVFQGIAMALSGKISSSFWEAMSETSSQAKTLREEYEKVAKNAADIAMERKIFDNKDGVQMTGFLGGERGSKYQ